MILGSLLNFPMKRSLLDENGSIRPNTMLMEALIKYNIDGSIERHKARVLDKGFTKRYDVDYEETFSPIARLDTIKLILSLVSHKDWQVNHMDVKCALLNGYLDEEVNVQQP